MLTSSDAKFRCLWHMFIWSILLTLVSQFYILSDHIAFYIFGSLCILVLPIVTSLYSNTAGRRGAGLLRVAYVLCDPVIACMALVPVLLINKLTPLIREMECLSENIHSWNQSLSCLSEQSFSTPSKLKELILKNPMDFKYKTVLWLERRQFLAAIEVSVIIPCILALLMGHRTRKMSYQTALLIFLYWLISGIECASMIEASVLCGSERLHYAITTEVTVVMACILANSYGLVTLCSYISPMKCKGDKNKVADHFDLVYKCVVGVMGVAFVELPQFIARIQMVVATSDWPSNFEISDFIRQSKDSSLADTNHSEDAFKQISSSQGMFHLNNVSLDASKLLKDLFSNLEQNSSKEMQHIFNSFYHASMQPTIPATIDFSQSYHQGFPPSFYLWAFKDAIAIVIISILLFLQRQGRGTRVFLKVMSQEQGCVGTVFDNLNTVFLPEKRDKYIITRCAKCKQIDLRNGLPRRHKNHYRSIMQSKPSNKSLPSHMWRSSELFFKPSYPDVAQEQRASELSSSIQRALRKQESLRYETDDFKVEMGEELRRKMQSSDEEVDEEAKDDVSVASFGDVFSNNPIDGANGGEHTNMEYDLERPYTTLGPAETPCSHQEVVPPRKKKKIKSVQFSFS